MFDMFDNKIIELRESQGCWVERNVEIGKPYKVVIIHYSDYIELLSPFYLWPMGVDGDANKPWEEIKKLVQPWGCMRLSDFENEKLGLPREPFVSGG